MSWAPGGRRLAYIEQHTNFISLESGAARDVIVKGWPLLRGADFTADGKGLLIASLTPNGTSVYLDVDLQGNAHVLLESDPHTQFAWAIPSADGRYVALNVYTGENNAWMIENF